MTKVSLLDARPLMPSGAPTPRLAPPIAVRLLVCGNADRGDDAAALVAVAHVLPRLDDHIRWRVEVKRCNQLDAADLVDVPPNETCVVVDTVVGIPPGETITLPLEELGRAGHRVAPRSSHALPIDQVVGIASAVRGCVPTGVFVGIGGGHRYHGVAGVATHAPDDAARRPVIHSGYMGRAVGAGWTHGQRHVARRCPQLLEER